MSRLALGLVVLCIATAARAQSAGNLQLDEFRPTMDSRGYLTLNGTSVLDHGELSFGLGSLEWGHHLLSFTGTGTGTGTGGAGYSVDNIVSATLVAALGLRVAGVPFEVGASLPFSVMEGTQDRLGGQGVGDAGLHLKAQLAQLGPVGLGALASVYLPTASPRDQFLGEAGVTPQVMALADVALGRWRLGVNAGIRLRPTSTFTAMATSGMAMGTITTSTELPAGVAVAFALAPEKLEAIAEVFGAAPLGAHQGYQPLEALGGLKLYLAKNSYLSLGAGRGLIAEQGNPDVRAFIGIVFEPKPEHRQRASLDDVAEGAPPPPPAGDPDADRDHDNVPDKDDRCPDEPGELWNQGCPYRDLVIDEGSSIVILESIEFEFDSATIKPSSFHVLDSVARALTDNPDIERVEIGGHTDERGSAGYNLALSNRRAASVVTYLVEHGIAAPRLGSRGYGLTRPLDPSHTEAAWLKNRRVEFIIKQRAGKACDTANACAAGG
ncbi:MAG TPA: OmpA family protein [Kofleriaceae bacterium]|nr:OmpA family protein [Kofleriaceae bacterium]